MQPAPAPLLPPSGDSELGARIAQVRRELESLAADLRQQISALEQSIGRLNEEVRRPPAPGAPGERGPAGPPGPPGPAADVSALAARLAELEAKLEERHREYARDITAIRLQLGSSPGPLRVRILPVNH
jgi:hypothetical protein